MQNHLLFLITTRFFPYFQTWIATILGQKAPNLPVTIHRGLSAVIGAAYSLSCELSKLDKKQWDDIIGFIRQPSTVASKYGVQYPQSKGRWDGNKGYREQFFAVKEVIGKIIK